MATPVLPASPVLIPSRIDRDRRIAVEEGSKPVKNLATNFVGKKEARPLSYALPESQREWAWESGDKRRAKQAKFIDSVMHNYPIQGIILNLVGDHYDIYDGRHRIETLSEYRNNVFKWNGALYRDLSADDREKFDNRLIPVTITEGATAEQLADIFIRLNSGKKLTDSDMLHAYRDTPFVKAVETNIISCERLKHALGNPNMGHRTYLANWAAMAAGLMTQNAGNMTNSYLRLYDATNGLSCTEEQATRIEDGVEAYCALLEQANTEAPLDLTNKKECGKARELRKVGKIAAYFFHEFMAAEDEEESEAVMEKYVTVVVRLRSSVKRVQEAMENALTTPGAQNLNAKKVQNVVKKITDHLNDDAAFENEDDEEDSVDE